MSSSLCDFPPISFPTFIALPLRRFMVDRDIVGCNWIELPPGTYQLRTELASGEASKDNPAKVLCEHRACVGGVGGCPGRCGGCFQHALCLLGEEEV